MEVNEHDTPVEVMTLRHIHAVIVALFLVVLAATPGVAESKMKPSLVLVTIDTLRADRLGCYGYHRETSPNVDELARESILFERAYTTMATTLPAHASMMTGTYTLTHRVQANVAFIPRSLDDATSLRTLAEMLRDQGYETAAFVSAAPLKRHSGIDRGFETFSQPAAWQRSGRKTTKRALKWLNDRSDRPFFLWVHYFDPHWPYSPPEEFRNRFRDTSRLAEYLESLGVSKNRSRNILRINNAYDAEIRYTDEAVGRLLDRLQQMKIWDDLVVVLTADHGEGMGQHDWVYHGKIYNEQLRIPLLIKLPGMRESRRIRRVTSLVDLLPILSSATGLPIQEIDHDQFQGIDVLSPKVQRTRIYAERVHRKDPAWGQGRRFALMSADWKYLHSPDEVDVLYDLGEDPHETRNVIELHPEIASELQASLSSWIETYRSGAQKTPDIDPETLKQLRSLGYVD